MTEPVLRDRNAAPAARTVLVALLLAAAVGAHAIDPQTALDALGFPADTRMRVEAGRFVEVALPTRTDRDLNVGIAFLVPNRTPAALSRTVREAWGSTSTTPSTTGCASEPTSPTRTSVLPTTFGRSRP